ncbi:uncharacterized protein BXIN_1300 [Babesia sp. Xinjiang]|uniref:uncharacterized protein n=1 Tax=Babesia sp. Xinjiang TaxID=462227 RepID=UPI000A23E362|nr:uncharacterized protein BXIN_1300 [Babesia sp. Xinjiang]ORM40162.1 hypothetical protein BXIN_1300 [Babesia sp. Xinjiang]
MAEVKKKENEECNKDGEKGAQMSQTNAKKASDVTAYVAAMVALCLYVPDQITSTASKHLTVSLDIPAKNTGIYMTKLYATKTLVNFTGSLLMLIVNMFTPANRWISSISFLVLAITRIILLAVYFLPQSAIYFYFVFIVQAFIRGLFENNFYPAAAEHMSVISLCYKGSRVFVWTAQVIMDIVIKDKATWMISFHLVLMTIATIAGMIGWFWCIFVLSLQNEVSTADSSSSQSSGSASTSGSNTAARDETMWAVMKRVYSPFLMCMFGWPQKNFYSPGIVPYALVDRSLCHPINIILMFFSFCVTFTIHIIKTKCVSISNPWGAPPTGWHLAWLFMIPTLCCVPVIYSAMHYPLGVIHKALHNNRVTVTTLAVILVGSTTVLDNMGYIGVSACSKDKCGKRSKSAMKIIAMTSFTAQFITSFTYRMSTGYLIFWRQHVDELSNRAPTSKMYWFNRLMFWAVNSIKHAGYDFVNEFKGNIRDVVVHDVDNVLTSG